MTAKNFLKRFLFFQRRLEMRLIQIENLQSMAKQVTTVISAFPSGGAKDVSRIEKSVVEIYQCTEKLANEIACALCAREEIMEAISKVENPDERLLLEFRYICFDSWKTIAEKMNYSLNGIFKLHSRALRNFAFNESVQ